MKKTIIPAVIVLVLSLLLAIGSQTFMGACVHDDGSLGACHWAARALSGIGGLLAVLAILALLVKKERAGLYLAMVPTALLGVFTPGTLINLCGMATMRCRALMKPAAMILLAFALAAALIGWLMSRRNHD
jgi:hypothetical protein